MANKNTAVGTKDSPTRKNLAPCAGGFNEIVLTPEEEELLTPDFIRESISEAMIAVQRLQEQASTDINEVLAMRDVLFAEWLRRRLRTEPRLDRGGDGQNPPTLFDLVAGLDLPEDAAGIQRLTEFASEQGLAAGDFLRLIDEAREVDLQVSDDTSDTQLQQILNSMADEES